MLVKHYEALRGTCPRTRPEHYQAGTCFLLPSIPLKYTYICHRPPGQPETTTCAEVPLDLSDEICLGGHARRRHRRYGGRRVWSGRGLRTGRVACTSKAEGERAVGAPGVYKRV